MDSFIEKLVVKKKTIKDHIVIIGLAVGGVAAAIFLIAQFAYVLQGFALPLAAGAIYLAYKLVQRTNIEYEYIVTNGSLDIDKIIARNKRQRIFSGECKDFEVLARVKGPHHGQHIRAIPKKINAESYLDSDGAYFTVLPYKGERTVVYFEPDTRMLDSFKRYIPSKISD
jgi:hypothetical protein